MRSTFKVLFYLKRDTKKSQKTVPVMGRITVNGTISQFSAKISVPEGLWDVSGNRAKGKSVESDRINRHLDNIRSQIHKHYQEISDRDGYVTAERVKNAYLGFGAKYRTLFEAISHLIDDYEKRVGVDLTRHMWLRYKRCLYYLRIFVLKEYRVHDVPLGELELSFIGKFHLFLGQDMNLKPNTLINYLKLLKYVVKTAFNNGWISRNPFASYWYTPPQVDRGFLTEEEIRLIQITPLRHKCQRRTRDMFLFSCFTGISHSDMRSMTNDQISQDEKGNWWITGFRNKTGTKFQVKLLPVALEILKQYQGLAGTEKVFIMPRVQVSDKSLKHIARACGITKNLTFHLARHTFATTISLMNGVPLITLSKMLGHKHITTTQIYAKVTDTMIDAAITELDNKVGDKFML